MRESIHATAVLIGCFLLSGCSSTTTDPAPVEGTIQVTTATTGDTLDVLARNDLGEDTTATPAIADDKLYIRTASHLWAFGD